ncbi:WC2 [Sanghuangporus weigelae]
MALQSPALAPSEPRQQSQQPQRQAQVFEFTKRKKWADILISELPDTVTLILDTDGLIQYVAPNVTEVLGWEVEELSERDVLDIVNDIDKRTFDDHLQKSLGSRHDLSCYARLKCKPIGKSSSEQGNKELLFEVRGHALYLPDDTECKCFFLVAKPYPSRNMAVLNTFLELKIENERLTQRLKDLKAQQDVMPSGVLNDFPLGMSSSPPQSHQPQFATFEFPASSRAGGMQSPTTANSTIGSFSAMQTGFVDSTVPGANTNNTRDEEVEDGGKKKKASGPFFSISLMQKKGNGQQYVCVTCGRTDSPEWRKGPRGPKTLCNACGLRWAKRSKRTDDVPIPYVQTQQQLDSGSREGGGLDGNSPSGSSGRSARGPGAPVANPALSVTPPTEMMRPPSSHQSQSQNHHQSQGQSQSQSRFENVVTAAGAAPQQVLTPSPTHATFSQSQTQNQSQISALGSGHYAAHPMISTSLLSQSAMQPSPASSHSHGYMQDHSQVQTQAQSLAQQPPRQDHYQPVYGQYQWPVNQHQGEGSYGY